MATDNSDKQLTARELLEARVSAMMDSSQQPSEPDSMSPAPQAPGAPPLSATHKAASTTPPDTSAENAAPAASEPLTVAPLNIDTAQSDAAIDDIVAQESDAVLAAEDAGLAAAQASAEAAVPDRARQGHPIFWFFIVLLVMIAITAAVFLTNPNL